MNVIGIIFCLLPIWIFELSIKRVVLIAIIINRMIIWIKSSTEQKIHRKKVEAWFIRFSWNSWTMQIEISFEYIFLKRGTVRCTSSAYSVPSRYYLQIIFISNKFFSFLFLSLTHIHILSLPSADFRDGGLKYLKRWQISNYSRLVFLWLK